MMNWQKYPFRLLLYVEWVLLGIALLTTIPLAIPHHRHHLIPPPLFNLAAIFCLLCLGVMGLSLPNQSKFDSKFDFKFKKGLYIASGFGLSWLGVLLSGRGERVFPALLLIVVIRTCLLFSWRGRIFVAIVAYLSFLSLQIMSLMRSDFFGIPLGKPLPPILRRLPPEEIQRVWFGLAFNSALLFALVLAFVLLLVGAVLAEHESKAKLVKAHHYALQIENQAVLQERNRIAREIHDSVGHYLTAQSIQLENTAFFLTKEPEKAANSLTKARQLGKEALANIRASVATLRKNPLQERSLVAILEQLTTEFQLNTDISITSEINSVSSLTTDVTTALYRIVQEALTNISKHSQATMVRLQLQETPQQIILSIQDNGCGFNPMDNTTGFGLQGIQERAEALRGKVTIKSAYGQGCQIIVEMEVRRREEQKAEASKE
jgi:signal transduction histidine kinase